MKKLKLKNLGFLMSFIKKDKPILIIGILCSLLSVICKLICPMLVGKAIDLMVGVNAVDLMGVLRYAVIAIILFVISGISDFASSVMGAAVAERTVASLRRELNKKLHTCPFSYLDKTSNGDFISRMVNDVEGIGKGLLQGLNQFVHGAATIVITIVIMFFINPIIASIIVVITPLSLLTTIVIAKKSQREFSLQQKQLGETNSFAEENISALELIKLFGREYENDEQFAKRNNELASTMQRAHFVSALTNPTTRLINNAVYVLSGIVGVLIKCSVGEIGSFLMYANQFSKPFNEITGILTEIQLALASLERITEVLNAPNEDEQPKDAIVLKGEPDIIEFKDVCFSYKPEVPLIRSFNLKVQKGKKVAIVGPTGAGKTTLVNLLMRFYDVNSGSIEMDGVNITGITKKSIRDEFGMVLQETFLFGVSVFDNLVYGNPSATIEEVEKVAKECHCHQFIINMEKGYDTVLDSSHSLSLGQIQLLSIARAMLSKPSMLILDEATSNIDSLSELIIQDAFDKLMKNKTTFVIAHRLSTIRSADIILVLNEGNIVEQGNHVELLQKGGFYAKLYNSQW